MESDGEDNQRDHFQKYDEALNLEDGEGFNDSEDVDDLEDDQEDEEPTKKTMAKLSA
jgi:hypothetical protein